MPFGQPLSVISIDSDRPGPCVVLTSNIHGDEATGIGIVHNLVRCLPDLILRGSVVMYPTLNPSGLASCERVLPSDGQDLNRMFPGRPRGPASERHAHAIWNDVTTRCPDLLVDLHTDAAGAIPYAIVDRVLRVRERRKLNLQCTKLAAASGLTVLREYPRDRYIRYHLDRSLPGAIVNNCGIPAVTLEVGPRRRLDAVCVAIGTEAALGILTSMGIVNMPARPDPSFKGGGPWRRESGPRTNHTGILVPQVRAGDPLERGTSIAEVRTIQGDVLEELRARSVGFVVALPERTHVVPGVSCATVAVRDR